MPAHAADTRMRATPEGNSTVAALADTEPLQPVAAQPYPVIVAEERTASRQALVATAATVIRCRPNWPWPRSRSPARSVARSSTSPPPPGSSIARHKLLADGLGATVRDAGHVIALDAAAMAAASSGRGHRRKERIPPGPQARAAATELRKRLAAGDRAVIESPITTTESTVIDLSAYERAAQHRSTLK